MNTPDSHTAPKQDSLQLALARVEAFETSGAYPRRYKKATMWEDLQALSEAANRLTRHNKMMQKNLKRFAPGTATVEQYHPLVLKTEIKNEHAKTS